MQQFNSDQEIKEYIEKIIDSLELLNECRLYKEEQLQITEDVIRARNSVEWIIRINKEIKNFIYAITKSYEYAKLMYWPLEESENSQMYSFYLEDAVYRDIVLWDLLRQFLNEFFECGYAIEDEVSIFSFLKSSVVKRKIGNGKVRKLKKYLNCAEHQEVRKKLRNQFTHSLDGTSSYIFHRLNDAGIIRADFNNFLPKHPYENIVLVLDDVKNYLKFTNAYIEELEKFLGERIIMVTIECKLKCGKVDEDVETWSINILQEKAEQILYPCNTPCDYAIEYQGHEVCKPVSVSYCRINKEDRRYKGKIDLYMSYEEMKEKFLNENL